MSRKAGIPLVELFGLTDRINSFLPRVIQEFVDRFVAIDYQTLRSPKAIIHYGKLQALTESLGLDQTELTELNVGIGKLSIPLVHSGLPFQLSMQRATITDSLEPAAQGWQLNLLLSDFILTVDGLEPAIYVPEKEGTAPRHLLRDQNSHSVRIIGSAVLRFDRPAGASNVSVLFIDQPDPFDPTLPSGAVAQLTFSPPHFFLGSSEIGLTVGQIVFDFSENYSPPAVIEMNQGASWVGLLIREATVYAPRNLPVVGDLSGGVRNLLLGSPMGIQGELEIQFGRSSLNPETFRFVQQPQGNNRTVRPGSGRERIVVLEGGQEQDITVHAGLPTSAAPSWTAEWVWGSAAAIEGDSSVGVVRHGSTLKVRPIEIVGGTRFVLEEITFRFVAAGAGASIMVTTTTGGSLQNVVHLSGTVSDIAALTLTAVSTAPPGTSVFEWEQVSSGQKVSGPTFTPHLADHPAEQFIVLRETVSGEQSARLTHLAVRLVDQGALLIGCESGVFDSTDVTKQLSLLAVEATFDLSDFHGSGSWNAKAEQAVLDGGLPAKVKVPVDSLARVTISEGGAPPVAAYDRHIQVLMEFNEDTVLSWGAHKPAKPAKPAHATAISSEQDLQSQLLRWASHYPDASFLVVGRCDDIGTDIYNQTLGLTRAKKGRTLLSQLSSGATGTAIATSRIYIRSEQFEWDNPANNNPSTGDPDSLEEDPALEMTAGEKSEATGNVHYHKGWLIKSEVNCDLWPQPPKRTSGDSVETARLPYRRIDIYATGGTPTDDAVLRILEEEIAPTLRRSFVPANDRKPAPVRSGDPKMDYRVKLKFKWDSPTVAEWKDAIPTLAEAEFAWTPEEQPLPAVNGQAVDLSKKVLTVYAKWIHDARTGFTRTTLGIRSDGHPDGLISTEQKNLTAALAFGPMLLSGVDAQNDLIGSGARVAVLIGAAAFAGVDLGGGPLVGNGSKTSVIAVEAEAQTRSISDIGADYQIKVVTDYVCTIHVNGGVLGLKTSPTRPMKIRYKKVGFQFDNTKPGWEKVGLAFDTSSMEIEDSGQWIIDGVLGSLLRIEEISMGRGSLWIEGRIAIAISIGVVEISEAIVRLTFKEGSPPPPPVHPPLFELRGFVLKADVPKVLKGEGRLRIEGGGVIRAGVDATLIPLKLGVNAAISLAKIQTPPPPPEIDPYIFLSLFLGVQFSTPLPLAQTGAAIYGFKGQFTMNGARRQLTNPDPVARELEWWGTPPENKYVPQRGQYAIGVGVVVGTLPDVSFCFSASGMLVVAFPNPEVILGVDVKVIEVPKTKVSDKGSPEGTITGLIVIDDTAVKVAVSAQYEIPKVLKLKVPFGAYFPYSKVGAYVRIGSDGQIDQGRFGTPISLTLLPGTLDAKAWAYLMIEQDGLINLGGDGRFSFSGFSVGFGAGWEIKWSAGPIKLSASAKVLVGFGTNPLMIKGGIFVAGELDLVVVSISARGELILTYSEIKNIVGILDRQIYLDGKFCGEVDLFFFSIKGCVGFHIGDPKTITPPPPEPPIASVSLIDRRDRIMGVAAPGGQTLLAAPIFALQGNGAGVVNNGASPEDNNTVWADTALVLHFKHYIKNGLAPSSQFAVAEKPTQPPTQPIWFGGNRIKYTYRLESLTLKRKRDGLLVSATTGTALQSVWMSTPYRQPNSSGVSNPTPSEHEGPNLKLLDWEPWNWVVNMDDGGKSTDGDPATEVGQLCDTPLPIPRHACVYGRAATGGGLYTVRLRQEKLAPPPYPSMFNVLGEAVARITGTQRVVGRDLQSWANLKGMVVEPGGVTALPFSYSHGSESLLYGYRVPFGRRVIGGALVKTSLPWEATFDRALAKPAITLFVCDDRSNKSSTVCINFANAKIEADAKQFSHQGIIFKDLNQSGYVRFYLFDWINTSVRPAVSGSDGINDLRFSSDGLRIELPQACDEVTVRVMTFGRAVKGLSLNAQGIVTDQQNTPDDQHRTEHILRFKGPDIRVIELYGGSSEAVLYEVCYTLALEAQGYPVVKGIIGSTIADEWPGRVIQTQQTSNKTCRVIEYAPTTEHIGPWNGLVVTTPEGSLVTVLAICGIDQVMLDTRDADQAGRDHRREEVINQTGTPPTQRRVILLEPGENYEIQVSWSYQVWQSNDQGTDSPEDPPVGNWVTGTPQAFDFAIAKQEMLTGNTQDGLNEYVFDARDVNRYLLRVEPADGRTVHFTGDPIWVHFDIGHVEQLLAQYGRKLKIEVKRTDPPPQDSPALLQALLEPLEPLVTPIWAAGPIELMPKGYQRINEAVLAAFCLPDIPIVGGASLIGKYDLQPEAMYDFNLLAPKTDGTDPVVVSATRFVTSRYANPNALMEGLGYAITGQSPYSVDDILMVTPVTLTGDMEVSDSLLDGLLRSLGVDTLPLPRTRAISYIVWHFSSGQWFIDGLLLDSLESLNRTGAVQTATGSAIATRCKVQSAQIQAEMLTVYRANENWTRVFLKPVSPFNLAVGQYPLKLTFETSSGFVVGTRTIGHRPAILDREGL